MCCAIAVLGLLGPRVAIVFWWLVEPARWNLVWNGQYILPILGFAFLPWTTLVFTAVWSLAGLSGWGWIFVGLAVMLDLATYGGGAFGNRERFQSYR